MLKSYVIDSSVYVSAFLPDELKHDESRRFMKMLHDSPIEVYLPALVVAEVFNVLMRSRKYKADFLQDVVRQFIDQAHARLIPLDSTWLLSLPRVPKGMRLKTSDLTVVFTAWLTKSVLVTWDGKMKKQAAKYVDVRTPEYFLRA